MNNTDYSFMTTGTNNNNDEPHDPELILQVSSLVTTFVANAIERAGTYIDHAGRNTVMSEDIKLCLKYETFKFLEEDNTEKIQKYREMIQEDIRKELNSDESDESDDDLSNDSMTPEDEFSKSKCECELCATINNIDNKWNEWIPESPLEKSIKKNIDKIPC